MCSVFRAKRDKKKMKYDAAAGKQAGHATHRVTRVIYGTRTCKVTDSAVELDTSPIRSPAICKGTAMPRSTRLVESSTTLPTGTVTFLFTDIEGSTRLWEQHPASMRLALTRHEALLRQAIVAHSGAVFKTVGDAVFAAFAAAPAALAAALAAQRALTAEDWTISGLPAN